MNLDPERLNRCLEQQTDPEVFSGVVCLSRGNEVLFKKASGCAIYSESIPNSVDTRFQIASGSKVFTAVGILHLVDEEKLSLSSPLTECVDTALPGLSQEIVIGHLLTHTSGITSYFEEDVNPDYEALWNDVPMYRIRGPRDFLPLMVNKPMKFSPGTRFEYNDGGFILLGLVIECVTGKRFTEYIEETVFAPADMKDSGYFATDALPGGTAYAYIRNPDGSLRTNIFSVPIIGAPDGGAYTTAHDMVCFWQALRKGRLLSTDTVDSMLQPHIATNEKPPLGHYGHGVWIDRPEDAVRCVFVEGYDPGVAFRSSVYLEEDIVLTLLGNTSEALWPLYRAIEAELGLK